MGLLAKMAVSIWQCRRCENKQMALDLLAKMERTSSYARNVEMAAGTGPASIFELELLQTLCQHFRTLGQHLHTSACMLLMALGLLAKMAESIEQCRK